MQFTVSCDALATALSKVAVALETKGELESYANVRLSAYNGLLTLSVVGKLNFGVEARIPAETGPQHILCGVSGRLLKDIVSSFQDAPVTFVLDRYIMRIEIGANVFKLNMFDPDSFSGIPNFDAVRFEQINLEEFFKRTDKVAFCTAASKADVANISPRYLSVGMNQHHFVATNGSRLAIHENKMIACLGDKTVLLSAAMLEKLAKVFRGCGESGGIFIDDSSVYMASGGIFAAARLSSDDYPHYVGVIPKSPFELVSFKRDELRIILHRAILLSDKGFCVTMSIKPGGLAVSSVGSVGESVQTMVCNTAVESVFKVNAKYLLETLEHADSEEIKLEYRGPDQVLLIVEPNYVNILSPIRNA